MRPRPTCPGAAQPAMCGQQPARGMGLTAACVAALLWAACAAPADRAPNPLPALTQLSRDAAMPYAEKYDSLVAHLSQFCDRAAAKTDAELAQHIINYEVDNRPVLKALAIEMDDWQKSLSPEARNAWLMRASLKPAMRRLRTCDPAMRNRLEANPPAAEAYRNIMATIMVRR